MGVNFNWEPLGGHHFGGDACPQSTSERVPLNLTT